MNKRKVTVLVVLLLFVLALGVTLFKLVNKPKLPCATGSIVVAEVAPPTIVKEKVCKTAKKLPGTRILERNIWGGNQGYFVQDEEYVYFGIYTTVKEEVLAE